MQTANQILMLQDFGKKSRQQLIKPERFRRLRFWWHYWSQGYSFRAAWLLARGR